MAESSDDQYLFNCPICLHLLNNPLTTSCGHSFCKACLNECWDKDDQKGVYSCPQCRQTFSPRPALSKNTVLAAVVESMKTEAPKEETASPAPSFTVSGDVECDICTETKLKAIKSCMACLASYCESHIQTHYTSAALKWHKLVNASPHLQDQICSQHHKPLELYCCQDQELICMQCALINHQNHSMTSSSAERQEIEVELKEHQDDLQKIMHQREMKVQELRKAVNSYKWSAEAAVKHCEERFTDLIKCMAERQAEITKMIRAQEEAETNRVEKLILTLEQEISDLKKRHEDLGQLSQIEDDIYVIQNFSSLACYQYLNLSNISVSKSLTFKEIETVVSELKSELDDLCEQDIVRISEKVPTVHVMMNCEKKRNTEEYLPSQPKTRKEFLIYFSHLNLNSSSACSGLSFSGNSVSKRSYSTGYEKYQVLCKEKLSERCYFEVECEGTGPECFIAFSYDQNCKDFIFGSNNRSWKCYLPTANLWVQHNNHNTSLVYKTGVFFDQAAGTVSFYKVTDKMTLLHRIPFPLTEPVYPGFSFKNCQSGSLLRICDPTKLKK